MASEVAESQVMKLYEKYRIRLVHSLDVPILWNMEGTLGSSLLLIDLPDKEVQSIGEKLNELRIHGKGVVEDADKENVPDGCVLAGDPLKVSFLTRDKLEKDVKNKHIDSLGLITPQRFTLKTNPVPSCEAQALISRLFEERGVHDSMLSATPYFVVADGSAGRLLLLGCNRSTEGVTSYRATYLGQFKRISKRIPTLSARFHALPLMSVHYRCSFDMLEEVLLCEQCPELVHASFMVHAEWRKVVGRGESNRHPCKTLSALLTMPPDHATATIKLKPGWLDERMAMADRVGELKQLKFLADCLRENKLPWGEYNSRNNVADSDHFHMLEALSKLISRAKSVKDHSLEAESEFTGSFWEIAKGCASAQQLADCFQVLYDEIRSGRFRVLVDAEDTSSLAKMLRVRNPSQIVFPRLEPFTCLQMLIELGVDHMSRDVLRRFRKEEFVANNADLGALQIDTSVSIEERIAQLIPAYLALQSMLMLDRVVRFAPHEKGAMAKKTIQHFISAPPVPPHSKELTIRVSVEGLRAEKLTNMCEWTIEKAYSGKAGRYEGSIEGEGRLRELLHITKETGLIKDLVPSLRCATQDEVIDETLKSSDSFGTSEEGNANYECVYLTSFTTPVIQPPPLPE